MPDVLHWLGIRKNRLILVSMSNMKYDAITGSGITVGRIELSIPDEYIPGNAHIEMDAKCASGYFQDES